MKTGPADVTICIPAYKSGDFIGRTLAAVSTQTYRNFRAIISIDGADEGTEAECRRFSDADRRFEVVVQPERLGWLGNTNALFDRVKTEFFFILPHDDLIAENYIETLRTEALAHPDALVVFCDMERTGKRREDMVSTPGLDGSFYARVTSLLSAPTEGVAWRGLTRSSVLAGGRRMRPNAFDSYNSHALWVLTLLCLGPFRHVPLPLYRQWERGVEGSVTVGWRSWPADRLYAAMAEYTRQCIETVSTLGDADPADRHGLVLLLLLRLLAHPSALKSLVPSEKPAVDRNLIQAAELLARMQGLDIGNRDTTERMRHDPGLLRLMAKVRVRDALHALAVNDIAAAEFALDSAIALDPENGDAYLRRAVLRRRQKRIEDAVVAIREAERLLPKNANVHMELADLLIRAGDLESAIIAAEEAIALDPKSPHGYFHLSIALSQGGRHAEALLAAERAMAAAPDQARFRDHHETLKRLAETPAQQGMRQS